MFKKIISFCLALIICLSLCVPAFAKDTKTIQSESYILDTDGNRLTFEMQEGTDGTYIMNYFVGGKIQTVYTIEDPSHISATTAEGETYTVDTKNIIQEGYSAMPTVERPIHFCTIKYNISRYSATENPYASVELTEKIDNKPYIVNGYRDSPYPDIVTTVASYIISGVIAVSVPPASAHLFAQAIVNSMLASVGGNVVNGMISAVFTEIFEARNIHFTYEATLSVGSKIIGTTKMSNAGTTSVVSYKNVEYSDTYHSGYTPSQMQNTQGKFAVEIWNGCCWEYTCPGYISYNYIRV